MLIKTALLHQSFGPRVFLFFFSLSLSLYFWLIPWSAEAHWAHFLAGASKTLSRRRTAPSPTREGAWCLRAATRALRTGLYWLSASTRGYQPLSLSYSLDHQVPLHSRTNKRYQPLSLSYFLIFDSGPPGSGPLKDQQVNKLQIVCLKFTVFNTFLKIKSVFLFFTFTVFSGCSFIHNYNLLSF